MVKRGETLTLVLSDKYFPHLLWSTTEQHTLSTVKRLCINKHSLVYFVSFAAEILDATVPFEMLLKVSGTHQNKSGSLILLAFKSRWPSCSCLEGKEPIRKPLLAQSTYV